MNPVKRLIDLDSKSTKRIFVIGDVMTDIYLNGRVEASQDGCPKFVEESRVEVPGGAANAARSLQCWNAQTYLPFTNHRHSAPTKTRCMVEGECVFRVDHDFYKLDLDLIRDLTLERLKSGAFDAVLISDYDKGMLDRDFIKKVAMWCHQNNRPCVADAKCNPETYPWCILKANSRWRDKTWESDRLGLTLPRRWIITQGSLPPFGRDFDCAFTLTNKHNVKCINHVGAGDCFAAHLTLALAHGLSLKEAAAVAYSAGRVYVQKPYNEPPLPSEVLADAITVKVVYQ